MHSNKENAYIPLNKWNEYYKWPSIGSLRYYYRHKDKYSFYKCTIKIGNRILINEEEFKNWVTSQSNIQKKG